MKILTLTLFSVLSLVFASSSSLAQDCEEPRVKFGEVMSGLQAGFTGGTVNDNTLPSGFYMGVSGINQRGFIDPESGSGWKCNSDWGLISAWLGVSYPGSSGNRTRQDARAAAETLIPVVTIVVDGEEQDVIETNAKLGSLPIQNGGGDAALKSWGVFLEPGSLSPGFHTAELVYRFDLDCLPLPGNPGGLPPGECDGIPDVDILGGVVTFEVIAD